MRVFRLFGFVLLCSCFSGLILSPDPVAVADDTAAADVDPASQPPAEAADDAPAKDPTADNKAEAEKPQEEKSAEAPAKDQKSEEDKPKEDKPKEDKPKEDKPKDEPSREQTAEKSESKEKPVGGDKSEMESKGDKPADEPKPEPPAKVKPEEPVRLPVVGYSDTPMLPGQPWRVHDILRPRPPVVGLDRQHYLSAPVPAPSDATVLLSAGQDAPDLNMWAHQGPGGGGDLRAPQWKTGPGYLEVVPQTGSLRSLDSYGSCQLHVEWMIPEDVTGASQGRGNSGVVLMGQYKIQILDSYNNRTYADGQAAAIFGQYPPDLNASLPPGNWQSFDIFFTAPLFDLDGNLQQPADVTVLHNGLLVHHRRKLAGATVYRELPEYTAGPPARPLFLEDGGSQVRFRNIWLRRLD